MSLRINVDFCSQFLIMPFKVDQVKLPTRNTSSSPSLLEAFCRDTDQKNKREKRKNKIGKKMSHSPFTRVCHCIPRGYTCPFFNCHRCYRSGRPILYISYSLWRWRSGDQTAACYCIIKYYTRIRLSKLSGCTWISKI